MSVTETLSLGDLCEDAVIGPTKLDSTSCPHLDHKHTTSSTQTEPRSKTPCPAQKRRAPHVKNSKYTVLNSSTGSSTSGVDVSSVSSRSDSHGNYPQHKSVCIVETPIDCPSSPDDTENPLVRQRSQSFRLAIERGTSIDSSLLSYDTGDPSSTSPDLSPEHAHPPPYPECKNRDHGQHSSMFSSGQFLNPPQQHRGKHDKLEQYSTDTTRSQRSRTKQEVNTKPTEPQVEMDINNKEINVHLGADDGYVYCMGRSNI